MKTWARNGIKANWSNCSGGVCHVRKDCSRIEEIVGKTMPDPKADDIPKAPGEESALKIYQGNETTGGETWIRWLEPQFPNERIVKYNLMTKTSLDLADVEGAIKCLPLYNVRL